MKKHLLVIAFLFLLFRWGTIEAYRGYYYFYGCVSTQFGIAEAAYNL